MSALPSLRQLHYLVTLSETLNFTRAAEACFVGQSTLSAGIKELESALDAQLVERDSARPMSGLLRLGVIPTIAPFVLPLAMPRVRERFPELRLALREDLTASLLQKLGDRELDFALIALPYDTGELRVEPLYDDEFWLVARERDAALKGRTIQISHAWSDRLLPEMAIKAGLLERTGLVARRLAAPAPSRQIALVTRATSPHQAEFHALAQLLRQVHKNSKSRKS